MDHHFYLGMAYAATVAAFVAEIIGLRVGRTLARRQIEEERELETQD